MALEVTHSFQSTKGDGPDNSLVQPSDWNAAHVVTMAPGLAGNPAGTTGPAVEIPIGAGLAFQSGALVNTSSGMPIGSVLTFAGNIAPAGWLFCYGQEISRTTYAELFSVISTLYGVGDAINTFNLPDLRGRVPAGRDNMGDIAANRILNTVDGKVLGNSIGTEQHILVQTELATHEHIISQNAHRHFVATDLIATADSTPNLGSQETVISQNTGAGDNSYILNGLNFETYPANRGNTSEALHSHTTSMPTEDEEEEPITFDQPHLNMQPTIILNMIIFTGVVV